MTSRETWDSRRGVAATEFTLTLPIFLLIIGGIMDLGWLLVSDTAVIQAARDGVRRGVPLGLDEDPAAAAEAQAKVVLAELGLPCDATTDCDVTASLAPLGEHYTLTLDISREYTPLVGLLEIEPSLSASFTMLLENP